MSQPQPQPQPPSSSLTLPVPVLTLSGLSLSGLSLSGLSLSGLSLEQRIQRWVQLDNNIKLMNDQVRAQRESRNDVESSILKHVADHNLSHATVRLKDGTLRFAFNVKQPPAITLAFLGEALAECCPPQQADAIMQHVRAKRDAAAKLVPEIRRHTNEK